MKYNVSILSEAEVDIDIAYIWYELRQINLGNKFYPFLFINIINSLVAFVVLSVCLRDPLR